MLIAFKLFRNALAPGAMLAAVLATPAAAGTATRLVDCDAGSCLAVTGHRTDAASAVTINGHVVATQGARNWRASVPVETVRGWSTPFARSVTVAVAGTATEALLPIGLFSHVGELAYLTVSAK